MNDSFNQEELAMLADEISKDLSIQQILNPNLNKLVSYISKSETQTDEDISINQLPSLSSHNNGSINYPCISPSITPLLSNEMNNYSIPRIPGCNSETYQTQHKTKRKTKHKTKPKEKSLNFKSCQYKTNYKRNSLQPKSTKIIAKPPKMYMSKSAATCDSTVSIVLSDDILSYISPRPKYSIKRVKRRNSTLTSYNKNTKNSKLKHSHQSKRKTNKRKARHSLKIVQSPILINVNYNRINSCKHRKSIQKHSVDNTFSQEYGVELEDKIMFVKLQYNH